MARVVMKCGHAAMAELDDGRPVCPICYGIVPGADEPAEQPRLDGRFARCVYCGRVEPSSPNLPFFEWRKSKPEDSYYCGCRGWD